jgi:hypothetical protein
MAWGCIRLKKAPPSSDIESRNLVLIGTTIGCNPMKDAEDADAAVTALPPLEALALRFLTVDVANAAASVAVVVRGRFVRRRKLSYA